VETKTKKKIVSKNGGKKRKGVDGKFYATYEYSIFLNLNLTIIYSANFKAK
jgi:hypothetical protein